MVSSGQIQNQPNQTHKEALGGSPGPDACQFSRGLFPSSLGVHNLEGTSSPILLKGVGNLISNAPQELTTPFVTWGSPGEHSWHVHMPITACNSRHSCVISAIICSVLLVLSAPMPPMSGWRQLMLSRVVIPTFGVPREPLQGQSHKN